MKMKCAQVSEHDYCMATLRVVLSAMDTWSPFNVFADEQLGVGWFWGENLDAVKSILRAAIAGAATDNDS